MITISNIPADLSPDPSKSYQYTITVGVIVPMVISVFLIMIICLLFILIRRWRRARNEAASEDPLDRIRTLSEEVNSRRGEITLFINGNKCSSSVWPFQSITRTFQYFKMQLSERLLNLHH